MGQELKQKRNEQFVRCREIQYEEKLKTSDLFSDILPTASQALIGYLCFQDLEEGNLLWHPETFQDVDDEDRMILLMGDKEAIFLEGDAAATVREEEERCNAPLTLRVVEVIRESNLVKVVLLKPNNDIN